MDEAAPIPSLCAVPSGSENQIAPTNGPSSTNPYLINASVTHLCWAAFGLALEGTGPISRISVSLKDAGKINPGFTTAPPLTV